MSCLVSKYENHAFSQGQRSFEQRIDLENCQSHADAHDETVEGKMGNLAALRVLIACQRVMNLSS